MTTAPQIPGFTQTVNAVVIRSTAGLCRPAGIVNKIRAFVRVKINQNTCCNPKRLGYSLDMKTNLNEAKQKMVAKLSTMDTIELSNLLCKMAADMSDEAGIVLEVGMEVMEGKMSEADFVRFCGQLEGVTA